MEKKRSEKTKSKFTFVVTLTTFLLLFIIVIGMFLAGNYFQNKYNITGQVFGDPKPNCEGAPPPTDPKQPRVKNACDLCKEDSNCNCIKDSDCWHENIGWVCDKYDGDLGKCKPDFLPCTKNEQCQAKHTYLRERGDGETEIDCTDQECYCYKEINPSPPSVYGKCKPDNRDECIDYQKQPIQENSANLDIDVVRAHISRESNKCEKFLYLDESGGTPKGILVEYLNEKQGYYRDDEKTDNDYMKVLNKNLDLDLELTDPDQDNDGEIDDEFLQAYNSFIANIFSQKKYLDMYRCCDEPCKVAPLPKEINKIIAAMKLNAFSKTGKLWKQMTKEEKEPHVQGVLIGNGITISTSKQGATCEYCNSGGERYGAGTCVGGFKEETIWALVGIGKEFDKFVITGGSEHFTRVNSAGTCYSPAHTGGSNHYEGIAFDIRNRAWIPQENYGELLNYYLLSEYNSDRDNVLQLGFPRTAIDLTDEGSHYHAKVNVDAFHNKQIFDWECYQTINDEVPSPSLS